MRENASRNLLITDLHGQILEKILSHLSYDEIAKKRIVCKTFDSVCRKILNQGYNLIRTRIETDLNDVKSILPRRESTRKVIHPRFGHFSILGSLDVNLNISIMWSYRWFMEKDLCCFIAGRVLDEAIKILNYIKSTEILATPDYKITKKFREITKMAREHFEEVVKPSLEKIYNDHCNKGLENNLLQAQNNAASKATKQNESRQTIQNFNYRLRKNKIAVLRVKGQIGQIRSRLHTQTQVFNKQKTLLESRLKRVEQELNCLEEKSEKQSLLELCKRIFSYTKFFFCKLHSAGFSSTENQVSEALTVDHLTSVERKINHLITLLHVLVFVCSIMVITYCL